MTSATDNRELHQFLLQKVAVAIERGNAAAVLAIYISLLRAKRDLSKIYAFLVSVYIYIFMRVKLNRSQ